MTLVGREATKCDSCCESVTDGWVKACAQSSFSRVSRRYCTRNLEASCRYSRQVVLLSSAHSTSLFGPSAAAFIGHRHIWSSLVNWYWRCKSRSPVSPFHTSACFLLRPCFVFKCPYVFWKDQFLSCAFTKVHFSELLLPWICDFYTGWGDNQALEIINKTC